MIGLLAPLLGLDFKKAWPMIKWGGLIILIITSHSCAYFAGKKAVYEELAEAQLKTLKQDSKENVARAERTVAGLATKERLLDKRLQELDDAINQANEIRGDCSCELSADELRVLNEIIAEANSSVSRNSKGKVR